MHTHSTSRHHQLAFEVSILTSAAHLVGPRANREHSAIRQQDTPVHKSACSRCQIKKGAGNILAETLAFDQSRSKCWHASSVPARVAGIFCQGKEPAALRSPCGMWAYSDVSFYSTVRKTFFFFHTTYLRHFRDEETGGNSIGPDAMFGILR